MNSPSSFRLIPWLVGTLGLIFAIYVGRLAGQSDFKMIATLFGSLFVLGICLWLRMSIWLLIPLCWNLTGKISLLPIPFSVRDLSVMLVAAMFCVFFALKMVRATSEIGWLEIFAGINLAYVASMFVRHPVGTSAFGSDLVGGRPYFDTIIAFIAFIIFRWVKVNVKQARIFPFFLLTGSIVLTALNSLVRYVPQLTPVIAPLYSGINAQTYLVEQGYQTGGATTRFTELANPSSTIVQILCSYFKPFTLLLPLHPVRFLLFGVSAVGILLSGFRGSVISMGLFFCFASYFHGGIRDLVRTIGIGIVGLMFMIALQLFAGLPLQAQRALSFIPFVPWNETAKSDADDSSQWRFEMWKMVLNEKQYIHDKVWGDGFGFSAYELGIMQEGELGGAGFIGEARQETFMINGAYHSGPLSSIRFAGVVGLVLLMTWLIFLSFQAVDLIRMARGTPFFATTLFFFMPMIYGPLLFVLVFGDYQTAIPETLFGSGMFRMIKNSLKQYIASMPAPEITLEKTPSEIPFQPSGRLLAHSRFRS